jgi:hypothetical protein
MTWRDWSEYQRSQAVNAATAVFFLGGAMATWAQGARGWATTLASGALVNVLGGLWWARREQERSDENGPETVHPTAGGPVWATNASTAVSAFAFSFCTPLVVAVGVGLSLAGPKWWFGIGLLAGSLRVA